MKLDYDIVIATANRAEILRVALPSMLRQTRPARAMIIADASDDHDAVARTVRQLTAAAPFEVIVFHTTKGASPQRNAGLAYATSPVIFFPDDDSVWYDDSAEMVMRVYERDTDERIGGVGQAESFESPVRISRDDERARRGSLLKSVKYRLSLIRHGLVNRLMDNPLHICGLELLSRHEPPGWLSELDCVPVERQIGFRMTYRANAVRRHRFDEVLNLPRSLWEDFALSFAVLQDQMLVEAKNAKVYHHQFGGPRSRGLQTGVEQFLNLCYIVCKYSPPGSRARRSIYSYTRVFFAEAALLRALTSAFEREKLQGFRRARREFQCLLESPLDELTHRYRTAIERCLR